MLRRMLALLASGETRTLESMALDLGVGRADVEDVLRQLCDLGYVEELRAAGASSCDGDEEEACAGCSGCGLVSSCGQGSIGRIWTLTKKGIRVTRKGLSVNASRPDRDEAGKGEDEVGERGDEHPSRPGRRAEAE